MASGFQGIRYSRCGASLFQWQQGCMRLTLLARVCSCVDAFMALVVVPTSSCDPVHVMCHAVVTAYGLAALYDGCWYSREGQVPRLQGGRLHIPPSRPRSARTCVRVSPLHKAFS